MATLVKEIKLVFSDVSDNYNKVWYGRLYDNDDCETSWGRIGYDLQSKMFPGVGESFLLKKQKEKERKGYSELKTIGSPITGSSTSSGSIKNSELHQVAKSQIIKSSNPTLERLIKRFVDANIHKITSSTQITYNSTTGLFATPLGIISLEGITEARDLLADLAPIVQGRKFGTEADRILSKYLRLIPQNLGMGRFSTETVMPQFLIVLSISIVAAFVAIPVLRFVHNRLPTQSITNDKMRRLADAGIDSPVNVSLITLALPVIEIAFSLFDIMEAFAEVTLLEYIRS